MWRKQHGSSVLPNSLTDFHHSAFRNNVPNAGGYACAESHGVTFATTTGDIVR